MICSCPSLSFCLYLIVYHAYALSIYLYINLHILSVYFPPNYQSISTCHTYTPTCMFPVYTNYIYLSYRLFPVYLSIYLYYLFFFYLPVQLSISCISIYASTCPTCVFPVSLSMYAPVLPVYFLSIYLCIFLSYPVLPVHFLSTYLSMYIYYLPISCLTV